jgi:hypothetical protein
MIQQAKSNRPLLDEQTFNKPAFAECRYRATKKAPLVSGAFSIWRLTLPVTLSSDLNQWIRWLF